MIYAYLTRILAKNLSVFNTVYWVFRLMSHQLFYPAPSSDPPRQLPVPLPQPVPGVLAGALPEQGNQQPGFSFSHQKSRRLLHQPDPLPLRGIFREDFRMIRLGDPQVEVSVKLLAPRIVVGMDHLRLRRVGHGIPRPDHL